MGKLLVVFAVLCLVALTTAYWSPPGGEQPCDFHRRCRNDNYCYHGEYCQTMPQYPPYSGYSTMPQYPSESGFLTMPQFLPYTSYSTMPQYPPYSGYCCTHSHNGNGNGHY